ncbi:hypothetical protein SDC9_171102 [bioreactor metagenome]|uniref:Uncharacterized protein n=1 Tax=bioreactor metagenome TaxID=1076179 RepID=A0A645GD55_9ZZZZ
MEGAGGTYRHCHRQDDGQGGRQDPGKGQVACRADCANDPADQRKVARRMIEPLWRPRHPGWHRQAGEKAERSEEEFDLVAHRSVVKFDCQPDAPLQCAQ